MAYLSLSQLSKPSFSILLLKVKYKFALFSFATLIFFPLSTTLASANLSFDCNKAFSKVEKLICSDDELANLDRELKKSYQAFMKTLDEKNLRKKLEKQQNQWNNDANI